MFDKRDVARFFSKVHIPQSERMCWEWKAGLFSNGYGQFKVNGQSTQAHRFAFAYFNGGGLDDWANICHSCDNRKCCNPQHLFGGSVQDNVQDAIAKNRREPQRISRSGERSNFAKLTDDVVRDIRADYAKGNVTQAIVAKRYGIGRANVGMIVRGLSWKHLFDGRKVRMLSTPEEFAAYRQWQSTQVCEVCGAKQSDRPRDDSGAVIDMWATETLCMACVEKLGK
jgi:hypothetical protein